MLALVQRHHRLVDGLQDIVADDGARLGVFHEERLSTRLPGQARERRKTDRKNPYAVLPAGYPSA